MRLFGRASATEDMTDQYLSASPPGERHDHVFAACLSNLVDVDELTSVTRYGQRLLSNELTPASLVVEEVLRDDRSLHAHVARLSLVWLDGVLDSNNYMDGDFESNLSTGFAALGMPSTPDPSVETDVAFAANLLLQLFWVANPHRHDHSQVSTSGRDYLYSSNEPVVVRASAQIIALTAIIAGRLYHRGLLSERPGMMPSGGIAPPRMYGPGWYPNPYNSGRGDDGVVRMQRYWDGTDWTDRCRANEGSGWLEVKNSLQRAPG